MLKPVKVDIKAYLKKMNLLVAMRELSNIW